MQGFTSSTLAHLRADERWREGEMSGSSRDSEPQVYRAVKATGDPASASALHMHTKLTRAIIIN